jgi:hypothetical protein
MAEVIGKYKELQKKLTFVRWINDGLESEEEDVILELMDKCWLELTDEEREEINANPVKSLTCTEFTPVRVMVDTDLTPGPRRIIVDVDNSKR